MIAVTDVAIPVFKKLDIVYMRSVEALFSQVLPVRKQVSTICSSFLSPSPSITTRSSSRDVVLKRDARFAKTVTAIEQTKSNPRSVQCHSLRSLGRPLHWAMMEKLSDFRESMYFRNRGFRDKAASAIGLGGNTGREIPNNGCRLFRSV